MKGVKIKSRRWRFRTRYRGPVHLTDAQQELVASCVGLLSAALASTSRIEQERARDLYLDMLHEAICHAVSEAGDIALPCAMLYDQQLTEGGDHA
jgi:hypothetical protein